MMPEYEPLDYSPPVPNEYINKNASLTKGKAFSRMSAQSIAHLVMVIFILLGNLSYYYQRKRG